MERSAVRYGLALEQPAVDALRGQLPVVAEQTVDAIAVEVGEYAGQMTGTFRERVEDAVRLALDGFLGLVGHAGAGDASTPLKPVMDAAYALGRGEARSGRTMSALLAAYRVGARVAWREWSTVCVALDMPSQVLARFAELVFSYIDTLSAASVTGHSDQLAVTGRVREQYRERLARAILDAEPPDLLLALADGAEWQPPDCLTAVLARAADGHSLQAVLGPDTLLLPGDVLGLAPDLDVSVLLAPGGNRRALLDALGPTPAIVGPTRPWTQSGASLHRARRLLDRYGLKHRLLDTEERLAELVVIADEDALRDLRTRVLRPLAGLRPDTAATLESTLRSWLLHQGRREAVAAELVVHPQTVRYRMTRLRELFGDTLTDPERVLEITVALAVAPGAAATPTARD
ncbi:MAG TPA: helix-turn-helix domain-containing protein [Kineosporiaceae bacterium]|nr:helix-turn-helix domain-containing protein [Kineosporiaceae bacterium]